MTTKQDDKWIGELVGALCDPIIVYPSGWEDTLPDWIKSQIHLERLIMNAKVMKEGGVPVGDTEALAYMYPRTMEAPMSEQWFRIYMYVFTQAMKFKKTEVPEDLRSETLTDYDMRQLDDLKRWIYQKRVQHRKEKARDERRQAAEEAETKEASGAKELETKPVQPSFF
ncbi:MAG: hypothetical protein Q8O16_04115 [Dehalococcoidia bacterium]|nr:hypothetical protein [Dehalococcoidia bacterium]